LPLGLEHLPLVCEMGPETARMANTYAAQTFRFSRRCIQANASVVFLPRQTVCV
jgi:hypothetical protein